MNKKYNNLILIVFSLFIIISLIVNYQSIPNSIIDTSKIFMNRVFPFLFIMMIFNKLLISLNLPYYLSKLCPSIYVYIFLFSALGGSPINAIIIKELLENKSINYKEGSLALTFSTLNNPLFLYSYMNLIFGNKQITFSLFCYIYIINILIMIYWIYKSPVKNFFIPKQKSNISSALTIAINDTKTNLLKIFATITFFKLISDILLPNSSISILPKGLLEITQGLNALTQYTLS